MAQNVTIAGAAYSDVPAINVPKTGGGTAEFVDTTDANAAAADIAKGKVAYVDGAKVIGTAEGAKPEQAKTLTLGAAAPSTVTPDSGKVLSSVPVVLDTSVIKAENIAKDVQMLGITGEHEGGGGGGELEKFISEGPTTAIFPTVSKIRQYAFYQCSSLTTASFPVCTSISTYGLGYCPSLTTVSFPVCRTIGSSAFVRCTSLTTVSFPACTTISNFAFGHCYSLTTVSFPACTSIDSNVFYSCSRLATANFPVCRTIGAWAFYDCFSLTTASFPACTSIGSFVFLACFKLLSLYLTGSSYVTLAASTAFNSTPIGGYTTSTGGVYGRIYVPASMLNSYKTRTNWSYFSSRFVGV